MGKNWEPVFSSWTKPPSDTEETRSENAVKMIKNAIDANTVLSQFTIEIFAQGSYANNTNVKLNSDVDVCVRNMDYLYCDYPEGKSGEDFNIVDSDYSFTTYKDQIGIALSDYFGKDNIKRGNKTFDIKSNTYRVEADAVPCFEHRRYTGERDSYGNNLYLSGIEFRPDKGGRVSSWPKQHFLNGIQKNRVTATQFKKVVRILRKLNYEMQDGGVEISKKISGYLLECLCWNTDNTTFGLPTYMAVIRSILVHIYNSTKEFETVKEWGEINELKYLFRPSQPWKLEDVNEWTIAAWNYIGFE